MKAEPIKRYVFRCTDGSCKRVWPKYSVDDPGNPRRCPYCGDSDGELIVNPDRTEARDAA